MQCDTCGNEAVLFQPSSGRHLCGRHLMTDIEARAKRTIRSHHWMSPGDHIAVIVAGDRKSAVLLYFVQKLIANRRDIRLSAVPVVKRETSTGGRSAAIKVADSLNIPCIEMPPPGGSWPAAHEGVTKIALAISLDDIAGGVLGQFLFGNAGRLVHPPPDREDRIPLICPFIAVPSDELNLYSEIAGVGIDLPAGTPCRDSLLEETESLLQDYTSRHPATKYALLHLAEGLGSGGLAAMAVAIAGVGPGASFPEILRGVNGNGA